MLCNWICGYSAGSVIVGGAPEPGAVVSLSSDWGDSFTVFVIDPLPHAFMSGWCRADDDGPVPAYLADVLPDLFEFAVSRGLSGEHLYSVDIGGRIGDETARERWVAENPPIV